MAHTGCLTRNRTVGDDWGLGRDDMIDAVARIQVQMKLYRPLGVTHGNVRGSKKGYRGLGSSPVAPDGRDS